MTERPVQSPITSPRSERVRKVAALTGRSARRKQGRFRVEGPQAARSLLAHRPDLALEVHLTERAAEAHPELERLAREAGIPARTVDEQILRAMVRESGPADATADGGSGPAGSVGTGAPGALVSPQGVVAVGALPAEDPDAATAALQALPADRPLTVVALH